MCACRCRSIEAALTQESSSPCFPKARIRHAPSRKYRHCLCLSRRIRAVPLSENGLSVISSLPRRHPDWAHPSPHLRRDWGHPIPHLHQHWTRRGCASLVGPTPLVRESASACRRWPGGWDRRCVVPSRSWLRRTALAVGSVCAGCSGVSGAVLPMLHLAAGPGDQQRRAVSKPVGHP